MFLLFFHHPPTTEIYTLFPTRRSSDLGQLSGDRLRRSDRRRGVHAPGDEALAVRHPAAAEPVRRHRVRPLRRSGRRPRRRDRKSTRLNSSHSQISYAVFCLKKKKNNNT